MYSIYIGIRHRRPYAARVQSGERRAASGARARASPTCAPLGSSTEAHGRQIEERIEERTPDRETQYIYIYISVTQDIYLYLRDTRYIYLYLRETRYIYPYIYI